MKRVFVLLTILVIQVIPQLKWVPMTGFPYITPSDVSVNLNGDIHACYRATGTALLSPVYVRYADSVFARPTGLALLNATTIHAAGNNTILIGDDLGRVYRSTDKGNTWTGRDLSGSAAITSIVANTFGELYLVKGDQVYMSRDYGETWVLRVTGPRVISNERFGTIFGCKEGGLYRSTDYGETWQITPSSGFSFLPNSIYAGENGYIYITSATSGIWRSTDQGATFTDITQGLNTTECWGVTTIPGVGLFNSNAYGIFRSTDHGDTWQIACNDNSRNFLSLQRTPQGHIYSRTKYAGVYRSTDSGNTWESVSAGFPSPFADRFVQLPSGLIMASFPAFGVWGSSDRGVSWIKRDAGVVVNNNASPLRRISVLPGGQLIVASNKFFYQSLDEGLTWVSRPGNNLPPTFDGALSDRAGRVHALARDVGLAVPSSGPFDWTLKYSATSNATKCYSLTLSHDSETVYFATNTNLIYSNDGMTTYTIAPGQMNNIRDMITTPSGRILAVCYGQNGISITTDNGTSWEVRGGATLPVCNYLVSLPGGRLFAGSETRGVFTSVDDGYTWEAVNDGLNDFKVQELYVAPSGDVWVSTLRTGMYKLTGLTSVNEPFVTGAETPESFSLSQNFPNPFNPETVVRYALPVTCFVNGVVYDLLGREVATLFNDEMPAGEHRISFNASELPSGVYFFRLKAGKFSSVIKMVVNK